tara:strand:- start:1761 stop:3071 length:1311 start_codon:yes stop_codon:yes gene_type:complete
MALVNFNKIPTAALSSANKAGMTTINDFAPDQDMLNALMKRGTSTAPVRSTQEGVYRALSGALGGYMKGRDKRELQSQKDNFRKTMAEALTAGRGTEGTAAVPEVISTPMAPASFAPDPPAPASADPSLLQTEIGVTAPTSILDDPSVPDVASLGLERIETPTGPGGQIIEEQAVAATEGTPGGLQPMLDVLRNAGTREADQAAIELEYGGMQQQAALEAQAAARAIEIEDRDADQEAARRVAAISAGIPGFDQEGKLRKEFTGQTKDYVKVRDAYGRIVASAKNPSAAGDLALIFNYMKVLDPGSTVREGEFATAQKAAAYIERNPDKITIPRFVAQIGRKLATGQLLSPNQRADFVGRAGLLYESQDAEYKVLEDRHRFLAEQYKLNPENVVYDMGQMQAAPLYEKGYEEDGWRFIGNGAAEASDETKWVKIDG